jgi:hypothetical protein
LQKNVATKIINFISYLNVCKIYFLLFLAKKVIFFSPERLWLCDFDDLWEFQHLWELEIFANSFSEKEVKTYISEKKTFFFWKNRNKGRKYFFYFFKSFIFTQKKVWARKKKLAPPRECCCCVCASKILSETSLF